MTGVQLPMCCEVELWPPPPPASPGALLELLVAVGGVGDGQGDGTSVGPRPFDGWNGAQL